MLFSMLCAAAFGLSRSTGPGGSNAQAVHDLGYTGQGIAVGLISQGHARYTHEAFAGHTFCYNATDPGNTACLASDHDTSVGGIICSRGGASYPNDKGAAPDAELYSVKVVDGTGINFAWLADALDYLLGQQCRVVVTAIQFSGSVVPPDGTSPWSLIYDYYAYQHNLVFATAAGNGESAVTVFGDTYNSITTGGLLVDANDIYYRVGNTSNPGFTMDGRQKPDVAAPSENQWTPKAGSDISWADATPDDGGQTSWAVPHTGGVAAVLLDYADGSGDADRARSEVIKAVMVNSTFPNILNKAGANTIYPLDPNFIWDTDRGYGRLDALRALKTLASDRITPGSSTTDPNGWAYDSVASGQHDSYTIFGIENQRLLVTVTWHRKVIWDDKKRGVPPQKNDLIEYDELTWSFANLDLEIRYADDPEGPLLNPTPSAVDNLEKADLLLTKTGNYEIRVVHQSGDSAAYGLAFEILEPLPGDVAVDYVVDINDVTKLAEYWLSINCDNPAEDCYPYNLNTDTTVINLSDFAVLAENWLGYDSRYYPSN